MAYLPVKLSGGQTVPLGDVVSFTASTDHEEVHLTWEDPDDIIASGMTLAEWSGTKIVRKIGSVPTSRTDGTVIVDSKVRDQYSTNALVDDSVEYGTTYYYRAFPYTTGKVYTTGSSVVATPSLGVCIIPTPLGTVTYDGSLKTQTFQDYDSTKMTVTGNTGTTVGNYTATFTLVRGYSWSDNTTAPKEVAWSIYAGKITPPSVTGSFTYDGSEKTATVSTYDNTKVSVTGTTGTNAGTYTATISLIDNNYTWSDDTTADKTETWTISQATGGATLTPNPLSLDPDHLSGDIVISNETGTIASVSGNNPSVATVAWDNDHTIRVTSVNDASGTVTVSVVINPSINYTGKTVTATVNATFSGTYGVEWDGSSSSAMSRTDDAVGFADPVPAVNNGNGSSPFDDVMPWAGMEKVTDADGGTLVKIPKYWYKWTRNGSTMKLQISNAAQTGFYVSPAHADRGDGSGEREYVYVGAYHCASSTYKSTTGVTPQANTTRADFRTNIHALGSKIWQYDFAMYWTIAMLYLVEYADWNSQAKIGYGCGNNSAAENSGLCDSMVYHTGTNAANRTTYGHTRYRYIEDLWGNVYDWVDGIYFSSANVYCIKNPSNFSDTSGGTLVGTRPTSSNYISAWNNPTASGFEYALYPSAVNGSDSTYVCDRCGYDASGVVLLAGGGYGQYQDYGLFCLGGYSQASGAGAGIGSRLQKLP